MNVSVFLKKTQSQFNLLDSQIDYKPLIKQSDIKTSSIIVLPNLSKSWTQSIRQRCSQNVNHLTLKKIKESITSRDESPTKSSILQTLVSQRIENNKYIPLKPQRSKSTLQKPKNLEILPFYLNFLRSKEIHDNIISHESKMLQEISKVKQKKQISHQEDSSPLSPKKNGKQLASLTKKLILVQKTLHSMKNLTTNNSDSKFNLQKQLFYDRKMKDKIKEMQLTIKELVHNLNQLRSYLNNEKKLFSILKKIISYNQKLKALFINEENTGIVDFSEDQILKQMQFDEMVNINGKQTPIRKYDFDTLNDLFQLKEMVANFILEKKINQIEMVHKKIIEESISVQKIESKIFTKERHQVMSQLFINILRNSQKKIYISQCSIKTYLIKVCLCFNTILTIHQKKWKKDQGRVGELVQPVEQHLNLSKEWFQNQANFQKLIMNSE